MFKQSNVPLFTHRPQSSSLALNAATLSANLTNPYFKYDSRYYLLNVAFFVLAVAGSSSVSSLGLFPLAKYLSDDVGFPLILASLWA